VGLTLSALGRTWKKAEYWKIFSLFVDRGGEEKDNKVA